jgi:hypothetical protein
MEGKFLLKGTCWSANSHCDFIIKQMHITSALYKSKSEQFF